MTLLTERHKYVYAFPNCLQGQEAQSNGHVASLPLSLAHLDRWLMHMARRQHRARQYAETRHWHTTDKSVEQNDKPVRGSDWPEAGRHEGMGVAGCGYLASESRPQHWLKKKKQKHRPQLSSFSLHSLYLSFIYMHDNWLWCCWQELIPKSSLSFVLCKRNRNIVQSITQKWNPTRGANSLTAVCEI